MQNNVGIIILSGNKAFDDIVLPLFFSLRKLNYNVKIVKKSLIHDGTNIVVDLCNFPDMDLSVFPPDTIIYNLEQLVSGSKGVVKGYINACSKFTVWDYSEENIKRFKDIYNITNVCHVPLGYTQEMTRISPDYPKDIDVLIYGALNERRQNMVNALKKLNINVIAVQGVYGLDRDILIARSKIIMNIHYYIPGIQEIVRLGYLWANKKAVVCECNSDTSIHFGYEDACIYAPYEEIPKKILLMLAHPRSIKKIGNAAYLKFSSQLYTDILESVVGKAKHNIIHHYRSPYQNIPSYCNIGSGKNFIPEAINIDISSLWTPDIVMDISKPITWNKIVNTERFGDVSFKKGMFTNIKMFDVLEHVSDIIQTMTNLLDLLGTNGKLHIKVPYDLSLGAWQDPTHLHAFNENSWLYFTTWHWYIGWREERFELQTIDYVLSNFGNYLHRQGCATVDILRQPRAVDSMEVLLRKRKTTFDEKMLFDKHTRSIYLTPQHDWL